MKKKQWNFAVVRSMFGDYWVGKTDLPLDKEKIFKTVQEAVDAAKELFLDAHPDFDPDDDESELVEANPELRQQYEDILECEHKPIKEIEEAPKNFLERQ